MTKREIILNNLNEKYKILEQEFSSLETTQTDKRNYLRYYKEIAYFVHYLLKTPETNKLLSEWVQYEKTLSKIPNYSDSIKTIQRVIPAIANDFIGRPDYKAFISENTANYSNPFLTMREGVYPLITLTQYFELLRDIKFYDNELIYECLETISSQISTILERWFRKTTNNFESIIENFRLLHSELVNFSYYEKFEHDYHSLDSIKDLFLIYNAVNPLGEIKNDTYHYLIKDIIRKGEPIDSKDTPKKLLGDVNKALIHIKDRLYTKISIDSSIDRFAVYISLYGRLKIKGLRVEKQIQEKFEEFIFLEGYYPISEAVLKNGRLDTLFLNKDNAFLCELKQINFSKSKSQKRKETLVKAKLKNAQIQSNIYAGSLSGMPKFSKTVFIILFSNQSISFENDLNIISKNGVEFIIKPILLNDISPSKSRSHITININDIIK